MPGAAQLSELRSLAFALSPSAGQGWAARGRTGAALGLGGPVISAAGTFCFLSSLFTPAL